MRSLKKLEGMKAEILEEMRSLGDMRRGSLAERYLPCGKPGCHCGKPGSQGHGPKYSLTWKEDGKTRTEYIPKERVPQVLKQTENHRRFLQLSKELVKVNEEICRGRLQKSEDHAPVLKKKLREEIEEEVAQEIDRILKWVGEDPDGHLSEIDLEAMEFGIRGQVLRLGATLLQALLARTGGGYRGTTIPCSCGEKARFVEYRTKRLSTLFGEIEIRRAYYRCGECGRGIFPQDRVWDVERCRSSPGLKRLVSRLGGQEPFALACEDLRELAGIEVSGKEVERISEEVGEEILAAEEEFRQEVFSGKVETLPFRQEGKVYIEVDGTGVPVVPRETAGRKGKGSDGKAHTREAKLGCVFTQTKFDAQGRPVRDEGRCTYVGGIRTAEEVGKELYAEVERRGLSQTDETVVLGDGAPWIWELAEEHFPGAVQIVDLYHAREHLWSAGHALYPDNETKRKRWVKDRIRQLDRGDIPALLKAFDRAHPPNQKVGETLRREREYFRKNRARMRYREFKEQGLFLGSGVIEAGCKSVIGHRLKQSGMRWTVRGANAIIALRRCRFSGGWEDFWADRANHRLAA